MIDWSDHLAVQGTLKSLLQDYSLKASILHLSAFFMIQLSHPYMTIGKTIALTRWTFVGKGMFLLLNMLSRVVITFFLRSKRLLISWLQSPSVVISEPKKIKSVTVSIVFPSICQRRDGIRCHDLSFTDYTDNKTTHREASNLLKVIQQVSGEACFIRVFKIYPKSFY